MKKIGVLLSVFILLLTFTCENEPLEGDFVIDNSDNTSGSFSVEFDGQTFVADEVAASILEGGIINITGLRGSNQESVILTFHGNTEGTYELGITNAQFESNGAAYSEANGSPNTWISVTDGLTSHGQVVISEIDDINMTMSGTFYFTAFLPDGTAKDFINGEFTDIEYTDTLVSSSDDNSFFAKVDGEEFVEDAVNGTQSDFFGVSRISISAVKNSFETIGITFGSDIVPGDYEFENIGGSQLAQYNLTASDIFIGVGTFTITMHDTVNKRIVGTFEFIASPFTSSDPEYVISEGSFDITYIEI